MSLRVQRVQQEVSLLQAAGFRVNWDIVEGNWVEISNFPLPASLGQPSTRLLLLIPKDYPNTPPNGIYVDQGVRLPSHYFQYRGDHNPLGDQGWGWYCFPVDPSGCGRWHPTTRVEAGDNLFKFIKLTNALMRRTAGQR